MVRLRIDLAYDGFSFNGWAVQPQSNIRTVQGEIEQALARLLHDGNEPDYVPRLTVAGRTDAGVHASHQVCHLDVTEPMLDACVGHMRVEPVKALETRLSRMMPDDIAIHRVSFAPEGFDARFSALERTYVYRISDAATDYDPRQLSYVWHTDHLLNMDAMNEAAALTLGLHDFGSFATPNPGGTTIREVKTAYWSRIPTRPLIANPMGERYHTPAIESGLLCFTIVADAFARNMVRSLVNACVQVGLGKRDVAWFAHKMAVPLREGSTGPIAPQGLTLEHVAYPEDANLAARANSIRAKRTLPTPATNSNPTE
ncbi:tRNA pseudouridine synthase A [Bifidobacterium gallicum]|uniref:tRNA pseudouridine synthase A n=1 Tax=Bifidobacterium gallicum DSM 20093 = LMG 11596 TaxID=561180 RepID=D1NVA6_9BIFI|nr:tRNA pseudouridine synthase A [Bifidobacterium gallicum]EFA22757.1 tRNA pseudouridine synthase A [Bifidobacterium gallicum DSM 20093 = LMG 11596]KFI59700.1 tRNA pseudouridine synthase A [Bifidobacterium gallicum DSM 20093 = LMG 11596]